MTRWWAELPAGRVVCLKGAETALLAVDVEVLPEDAPAIIGYSVGRARSVPEMVAVALNGLEQAAVRLFPAWLPDARGLARPARRGRTRPARPEPARRSVRRGDGMDRGGRRSLGQHRRVHRLHNNAGASPTSMSGPPPYV